MTVIWENRCFSRKWVAGSSYFHKTAIQGTVVIRGQVAWAVEPEDGQGLGYLGHVQSTCLLPTESYNP